MYLVAQHGECRSQGTGKIKVFPLPKGVKIMFVARPGHTTPYSALYNMKASSVYNGPGRFVPDLILGADYSLTKPLAGHTWRMPVRKNIENRFATGQSVSISNLRLSRKPLYKSTEHFMSSARYTPIYRKAMLKGFHFTTLSRLVEKLGRGTYVVASCRTIGEHGNVRARITESINRHGGNLNKVLKEFPNLENRVSLVVPLRGQGRV